MRRLFISDLHLDAERAEGAALFGRFLDRIASAADELYILGDFLEYWLGDDDDPAGLGAVLEQLRTAVRAGLRTRLMHGNRDFLIGQAFCERYALESIDDPYRLRLHGVDCGLMHGDTLCTDDLPYQAFRRQVRSPDWQRDFLGRPIEERRAMVLDLRRRSREATREKRAEIMDVNADAVDAGMRRLGVRWLIHGHTHRPGIHSWTIDGRPARRIVLGDWYRHGSYLLQVDDLLQLNQFDLAGDPRVTAETRLG